MKSKKKLNKKRRFVRNSNKGKMNFKNLQQTKLLENRKRPAEFLKRKLKKSRPSKLLKKKLNKSWRRLKKPRKSLPNNKLARLLKNKRKKRNKNKIVQITQIIVLQPKVLRLRKNPIRKRNKTKKNQILQITQIIINKIIPHKKQKHQLYLKSKSNKL